MPASFIPQDFKTVYAIDPGISTQIVAAATTTGPGFSALWGVPPGASGQPRTAAYSTRGTYSVCTATLKASIDGGTTYNATAASATDIAAAPYGVFTNLVTGVIYRLDITTFTGTSISVDLTVS